MIIMPPPSRLSGRHVNNVKVKKPEQIISTSWLATIILLLVISLQQTFSTPITARYGHTATFAGGLIYFIGGRADPSTPITDFITLNVTEPFLLNLPPWQSINSENMPSVYLHTAVTGDEKEIVVFGGISTDYTNSSLYVYNITGNTWSHPTLPSEPPRRAVHTASCNSSGIMFIYGGISFNDSTAASTLPLLGISPPPSSSSSSSSPSPSPSPSQAPPPALVVRPPGGPPGGGPPPGGPPPPPPAGVTGLSDFWGLNTHSLSQWGPPSSTINAPGTRVRHTSSIVGNKLVIVGGASLGVLYPLDQIYSYDMEAGNWQSNTAKGSIPAARRDHSAVVVNNSIIIYGGSGDFGAILGDLAVLDTTNWTWMSPQVFNPPPPRLRHTATIVGANMIVAFGYSSGGADGSIFVLNTQNWTWTNSYTPLSVPSPTPTDNTPTVSPPNNTGSPTPAPASTGSKTGLIVGVSVGGAVVVAAAIGIVVYFVFRGRGIRDNRENSEGGFEVIRHNRHDRHDRSPTVQPSDPPMQPYVPQTFAPLDENYNGHYTVQMVERMVPQMVPQMVPRTLTLVNPDGPDNPDLPDA